MSQETSPAYIAITEDEKGRKRLAEAMRMGFKWERSEHDQTTRVQVPPGFVFSVDADRSLLPYQQRVVDEKDELDGRLKSLNAFIGSPAYGSLDPRERARMSLQAYHMAALSSVLGERINAFGSNE